jgi:NAD(P)-dependent dehydrogenase (short-subunit alcohol dehydrogenase family)
MIGSIGGRFTLPFIGPLAASKSGLATMSEALRQELALWNVRVVLVEPASIRSDAVGRFSHDARPVLNRATSAGRALCQDAFQRLVATFAAQHARWRSWPRSCRPRYWSAAPQARPPAGPGSRVTTAEHTRTAAGR